MCITTSNCIVFHPTPSILNEVCLPLKMLASIFQIDKLDINQSNHIWTRFVYKPDIHSLYLYLDLFAVI